MRNHGSGGGAAISMAFPAETVPPSGNKKFGVPVPDCAGRHLSFPGKSDCRRHDLNAMNTTPSTETLLEPRQPHGVTRAASPFPAAVFFLNQAALATALYFGSVWFAVPLVL